MKKHLVFLASFAILSFILAPRLTAQQADLTGTWNVVRTGGHRLSTILLKQSGDRVEGTWSPQGEPSSTIEKGFVHADKFSCTVFRHNSHYDITATIHGSEMVLEITQEESKQAVHATATRFKAGAASEHP